MYLFRESPFAKNAFYSRGKHTFLPAIVLFFIFVGVSETLSAMPASAWVFIAEYNGMSELVLKYMGNAITAQEYQAGLTALVNEATETVFFTLFLMLGSAVMAGTAFFYMLVIEKRSVVQMGVLPTKKQALLTPLWLLIGALAAGVIVALAYLSGAIHLTFTGLRFEVIFAFLAHAVRATSYTLLFAGCLLPILLSYTGSVLRAVAFTAAAFAYQALLVPAGTVLTFLNAIMLAVFICLLVIRTGNVWAGCLFTVAWDLVFGGIFGSVTAGGHSTPALFTLLNAVGRENANGGDGGLTAGYVASLVLVLLLIAVLYSPHKKIEKNTPHDEGGFFYS